MESKTTLDVPNVSVGLVMHMLRRYTFFSSFYYLEILNLLLRKESLEGFGSILVSPVCWVCGMRMSTLVVLTWRHSR